MSERPVTASLLEDGTVLRLVLDEPPGNVLTMAMVAELGEALEAHRGHQSLRLVLLRGAGRHFSFGASVEEHRREMAPDMLRGFHRLLRELAAYPVPTAALVEGSCLGGGFELALCCHFLFAAEGARFGCPEIKLGVYPPLLAAVGSQRLGSLVAERLLLTGETLDAAAAERLGFLAAPVADADLEEVALAWYRKRLRPLSAFALRQGTRAVRSASGFLATLESSLEAAEQQYLGEVLASHDGNEGIEAFLEKRPPVWSDS
ncbi:MAG: cyclohexa-1,5-dienecarbonyl-CoA hydratase [bacterium]|nr:cyclohexa-1,5-dienecarbonyl-CoA hydratase [bacterium]